MITYFRSLPFDFRRIRGNVKFSMIARGEKNEILDVWNCDDLETAFRRAEEIFGIKESEWGFKQTS